MRRYNCALGGLTMKDSNLIPVERIEKAIYLIRGEQDGCITTQPHQY
jgi:hypothetical protein